MKPKPLASLNHFTVPCSAMVISVFLSIDLRWRDSEVLKAGYRLVGESCSRPTRSNAVTILRATRAIRNPIPGGVSNRHALGGFDVPPEMRSSNSPHRSTCETPAAADAGRLNAMH